MDLSGIALFKGLEKGKLGKIAQITKLRPFQKGEILFMEGDPPDYLWLILNGEVKVFKEYASGKSAILGIFGPGDIIAEVPVIDDKPYPATGQAATAGEAGLIARKDALHVITSNPAISLHLMRSLGKKLRELTGDLGSMSVQSVLRRLSRLLLKLATKMGEPDGKSVRMDLFLTRKDLAECIGTSFEVAVRALGKLQNEKILEIQGKRLLIIDKTRLKKLAAEEE